MAKVTKGNFSPEHNDEEKSELKMAVQSNPVMPIKEADIKEAITNIFNGLKASSQKDAMSTLLYDHIEKNLQYFKDPEDFHLMCNYKFEQIIESLIGLYFQKEDDFIADIYLHYEVYNRNITKVTEKMEGWTCSVDRARFILRKVLEFRKTNIKPVFEKTEKAYQVPALGSFDQWYDLVKGIHHLQYGNPIEYLFAFSTLIEKAITNT